MSTYDIFHKWCNYQLLPWIIVSSDFTQFYGSPKLLGNKKEEYCSQGRRQAFFRPVHLEKFHLFSVQFWVLSPPLYMSQNTPSVVIRTFSRPWLLGNYIHSENLVDEYFYDFFGCLRSLKGLYYEWNYGDLGFLHGCWYTTWYLMVHSTNTDKYRPTGTLLEGRGFYQFTSTSSIYILTYRRDKSFIIT